MIDKFKKFLQDVEAPEFYIVGVAGTGKTTGLAELISYCIKNNISSVTCAYTHKAVGVLRSKLPKETDKNIICTLHAYLKKRPTINDQAVKLSQVDGNAQADTPSQVSVIFVDEFSMTGEKDYSDILALQYDEEGKLITKVVYIGDPNQLPPVKDQQTIFPHGDYVETLTKIYRQKDDNPLIDTLLAINDFINGEDAVALKEHSKFKRGQDIVELYKVSNRSKVLLAYTNAQVEYLNSLVQGYSYPAEGDTLYSPTVRQLYTLENIDLDCDYIVSIRGDIIDRFDKYKTLETLKAIIDVQFFVVLDNQDRTSQRAVVFGHDTYLRRQQELAKIAVKANKKIESKFKADPKVWSNSNWSHPLAKERAQAWKDYLAFKNNVICIDFAHAMTIHKSQGSTYDEVYLDMEDINKCANKDYKLYLKLLYVAISRAADIVYTN